MRITINEAIQRLGRGEVVALPTDTVYGLACDFRIEGTVAKLFELKGRPEDRPIPLLAADREAFEPLIQEIPPYFNELTQTFWPGALTLVVPARLDRVPNAVRAGRDSVALRVPDHLLARKVLQATGALAVTSANRSGEPPLKSGQAIEELFGPTFPVVEEEKQSQSGRASTILEWQGKSWLLLREGQIERQALAAILGGYLN